MLKIFALWEREGKCIKNSRKALATATIAMLKNIDAFKICTSYPSQKNIQSPKSKLAFSKFKLSHFG